LVDAPRADYLGDDSLVYYLNRRSTRQMTTDHDAEATDVDGDGQVTALDALTIINVLYRSDVSEGGSQAAVGARRCRTRHDRGDSDARPTLALASSPAYAYGAWTTGGEFLDLPEFDMERLLVAWQDAVFELYLADEKIEPAVVENMRNWPNSGFSVDQSVFLPAGDQTGIERLIQYMTRCLFSLSRLVKVSDTGQVVYQAEKQACRAFSDPKGDGMRAGVPRNFQILEPLDFLAEFTKHIPPKGAHLIRYYGWYSNKSRGMRRKLAAVASA